MEQQLSERQHSILNHVIQDYILTAKPVSSRSISKRKNINLSAASVRNVMSDLEEMGFIESPHTSAGRVPTDLGYRYYVDGIKEITDLSTQEKEAIQQTVETAHGLEEVMEITTLALSKITRQLGVAVAPNFNRGIFHKIDFVQLSATKILLILALQSGMVKTVMMEIDTDLDLDELKKICGIFNERFCSRTLGDIQQNINDSLKNLEEKQLGIIRLFIPCVEQLFEETSESNIHTSGVHAMLAQPEFMNQRMIGTVMEFIEDKNVLVHFLSRQGKGGGVSISIGGENESGQFRSFSIVSSGYKVGNMQGSLGVIGPTRMPYPKLISAVDYTARLLEEKKCSLL